MGVVTEYPFGILRPAADTRRLDELASRSEWDFRPLVDTPHSQAYGCPQVDREGRRPVELGGLPWEVVTGCRQRIAGIRQRFCTPSPFQPECRFLDGMYRSRSGVGFTGREVEAAWYSGLCG